MSKERACKSCGVVFPVVELSRRGYCSLCAAHRMLDNLRDQRNKAGPYYEAWKQGMRRYISSLE